MKGVILAGGNGSRLFPLTKTTNKHLLPIYNKQMILYPLETLKKSGITNVLIISGPGHAGQFLELLGSGYDEGLDIKYAIQEKALGIAHAIWVAARDFAKGEEIVVILGDNILEESIEEDIKSFKGGAKIFLKKVKNPKEFGVAEIEDGRIKSIEEKPKNPKSDLAVVGVYIYDKHVYEYSEKLAPSERNEVEVTDLNNVYLEKGQLDFKELKGNWLDAGTIEGLFEASEIERGYKKNGNKQK
ncbi:spore coat protein [Candidatus Woesearchaeota archaeon B3_Woes]|nr:MAG: spore coat protein [Candidatus Woesearchaeota archaeon B3_Woes]